MLFIDYQITHYTKGYLKRNCFQALIIEGSYQLYIISAENVFVLHKIKLNVYKLTINSSIRRFLVV